MKYQEYIVNQAKGVRLFEAVRLDGMILEKGTFLMMKTLFNLNCPV